MWTCATRLTTARGLAMMIDGLRQRGFRLVEAQELLAADTAATSSATVVERGLTRRPGLGA